MATGDSIDEASGIALLPAQDHPIGPVENDAGYPGVGLVIPSSVQAIPYRQ
jgi:hypothetical protein